MSPPTSCCFDLSDAVEEAAAAAVVCGRSINVNDRCVRVHCAMVARVRPNRGRRQTEKSRVSLVASPPPDPDLTGGADGSERSRGPGLFPGRGRRRRVVRARARACRIAVAGRVVDNWCIHAHPLAWAIIIGLRNSRRRCNARSIPGRRRAPVPTLAS